MKSTFAAFAFAFAISAALTPVVRRIALAAGAFDEEGGRRVHSGRIPRLGGLAVAVAFFVPLTLLLLLDSSMANLFFKSPRRILGLGIGSAIVLGLGAVDDVRGVRPRNKLFVQSFAAVVAWWGGYGIHAVVLPVIGRVDFGIFSVAITILWFVGVINALNLIDGLDGLAAGIAFFACITNIVVGSVNESLLVVLLSAALGGALMGFLIYNFNPASIFMGDSGSMFLGFVLAATSLLGSTIKSSTTVAIIVPVVLLGVPITDTVWALARRLKERRSIFSADRGHIHHMLLELGLSQRRAVMLLYGFSVALALVAVGLALGRSLAAGGALIVMATMLVGVVRTARSFALHGRPAVRQRARLPLVEELRFRVPRLLRELDGQLEVGVAVASLDRFTHSVGMPRCSLQLSYPSVGDIDSSPPSDPPSEAATAGRRLEYRMPELGDRARIKFWLRDSHKDDQVHVLLQLVADAVERCLRDSSLRAHSLSVAQSVASASMTSADAATPHHAGKPSPI